MEGQTVAETVNARAQRLEGLSAVCADGGVVPDEAGAARLRDLLASVESLERAVARAEESVASEREDLDRARALEARLLEQQGRLMFFEAHRPKPQPQPRPKPQPQRRARAARGRAPLHERTPSQLRRQASSGGGKAPSQAPQAEQRDPQQPSTAAAPAEDGFRMLPLEEGEVEEVPAYMRGRLTGARVARAMDEIHAVLDAKYRLVSRPISRVPEKARGKYKAWREQECAETKGERFFADSDLVGTRHIKQDATGKAILNVLRHLGRIRHVRGAARRYIVVPAHRQ